MPSLDKSFLDQLNVSLTQYPVFVESGTLEGHTIFPMEPYFDELHTVEIKPEYYVDTKRKYNGNKIRFHLGDSSKVFKTLLPTISRPSVFFLDGHWSAGNTGRGEKDCPLYEELDSIMKDFKHNAVIIVDDCRLFGLGPSKGTEIVDWENINVHSILNIVSSRLDSSYFLPSSLHPQDRLILHLNAL